MKRTFLVVDDEQGIRDLLVFLLKPMGHEVFTAKSGKEALAYVRIMPFDVIFLDIHMPKITGSEVFKIIRQLRPEQKIIVFTSSLDITYEFEAKAMENGAFACLLKPLEVSEILGAINNVLGEKTGSLQENNDA